MVLRSVWPVSFVQQAGLEINTVEEEVEEDQDEQSTENTETELKDQTEKLQQGPESFMVTPW